MNLKRHFGGRRYSLSHRKICPALATKPSSCFPSPAPSAVRSPLASKLKISGSAARAWSAICVGARPTRKGPAARSGSLIRSTNPSVPFARSKPGDLAHAGRNHESPSPLPRVSARICLSAAPSGSRVGCLHREGAKRAAFGHVQDVGGHVVAMDFFRADRPHKGK